MAKAAVTGKLVQQPCHVTGQAFVPREAGWAPPRGDAGNPRTHRLLIRTTLRPTSASHGGRGKGSQLNGPCLEAKVSLHCARHVVGRTALVLLGLLAAGCSDATAALHTAQSVSAAPDTRSAPSGAAKDAAPTPSKVAARNSTHCETSRISGQTNNGDGTTTYTLVFPDGHSESLTGADSTWNSATASDALIAKLGLPPRPKRNGVEANGLVSASTNRDEWVRDMAHINTVPSQTICTGVVAGGSSKSAGLVSPRPQAESAHVGAQSPMRR